MTDLTIHKRVDEQMEELRRSLNGCPEPYLTLALGNFSRIIWERETLRQAALDTCATWKEIAGS